MSQRVAFEHFDPQIEIGKIDENGNTVRPRKKPGRKPNPPTPAQRKAQNRAAQRAFRERKRQEMREAEMTIRKCIHMRDQAIHHASILEQQVEQLRFENSYLKGHLLVYKLACVANGLNLPKLWAENERDGFGCDTAMHSNIPGIPQILDFFLDSKRQVINMVDEWTFTNDMDSSMLQSILLPPPPPPPSFSSTASISASSIQQPNIPPSLDPYSSSSPSYMSTNGGSSSCLNAVQPPPTAAKENLGNNPVQLSNVDMSEFLHDLPTEATADTQSFLDSILESESVLAAESSLVEKQQQQIEQGDHLLPPPQQQQQQQRQRQQQQPPSPAPAPSSPSSTLQQQASSEDHQQDTSSAPNSRTRGPMTAMEYLEVIRKITEVDDESFLLFAPTELQRLIPHDPRIDLIPGPMMRDWLIIYKDFYDAEDLFMLLMETALFKGGQIGDPDCWYVPDIFLQKYWFILPNHTAPRCVDEAQRALLYASARHMLNKLDDRKRAYIQRSNSLTAAAAAAAANTNKYNNNNNDVAASYYPAGGFPLVSTSNNASSAIAGM